jgi:predicted O-linked N-acetylglucosamine transferase (SPINDLY family)
MSAPPPNNNTVDPRLREALAHHQDGRLEDAGRLYEAVLADDPEQFDALNLSGALALQRGDAQRAVGRRERAVAMRPGVADAWCHLGLAREAAGEPAAAVAPLERALAVDPSLGLARAGLARALLDTGRLREAMVHATRAARDAPGHVGAWRVLAEACEARDDQAGCDNAYRQALKLAPDDPELHYNLGLALDRQGNWPQALECYQRALAIQPDLGPAISEALYVKRGLFDWDGVALLERRFLDGIRAGEPGFTPFLALAVTEDRSLQRRCAETWAARFAPPEAPYVHTTRDRERITVGYLSSGFYRYPTAQLLVGALEHHDRDRFRVVGLDASPDDGSELRRRLTGAFDEHLALRQVPPREAARRIVDAGVDVLVDLKGYSSDAPTAITALRPAPVQVSWLGYPGTVSGRHVDYLIADPRVIPDAHLPDYPEAVVRLPGSYQANDDRRGVPEARLSRADCGLPGHGPVACCFNQPYKIGPDQFDIWMRILTAVPEAVLWLLEPPQARGAADRLREAARARGVDPDRLVFAPKRGQAEYLAQLRLADLFLDSFPYTAHTTGSDALWMGCPILTRAGGSFASRVAASLLHACDLPGLVAGTAPDYEREAIALLRDPDRLAGLRAHLEENRAKLALFDTARFTSHLEKALEGMWTRYHDGRAPAGFDVAKR